jgi:hypothetical protein
MPAALRCTEHKLRSLRPAVGDLQKDRLLDRGEELRAQAALRPEEVLKARTSRGKHAMKIIVACGFALALVGSLAIEVAAQQSSCSAENRLCLSRGGGARCAERMARCRRTGCWDHIPKYGGPICGLRKS